MNYKITIEDRNTFTKVEIEADRKTSQEAPEFLFAKFCKLLPSLSFTDEEITDGIRILSLSVNEHTTYGK